MPTDRELAAQDAVVLELASENGMRDPRIVERADMKNGGYLYALEDADHKRDWIITA